MKYTVFGFSQKKLCDLGIGIDEACILRFFIDFKDSGKMKMLQEDGEQFFWVKYDAVKEELPILKISKDRVYRKLKHLAEVGILKHKTMKEFGTYSFYGIGEKYIDLIDDLQKYKKDNDSQNDTSVKIPTPLEEKTNEELEKEDKNTIKTLCDNKNIEVNPYYDTNMEDNFNNTSVKIPEGQGKNTEPPKVKTPEGYGKNNLPKDYSTSNSSSREDSSTKIIKDIVEYLNETVNAKYKATTVKTQQLIKARLKEGFTLEQFKDVIDKKAREWTNTNMEKYLTPITLFGNKFESYVNQKIRTNPTSENANNNRSQFGNYDQRKYDFKDLEKKLLGWD